MQRYSIQTGLQNPILRKQSEVVKVFGSDIKKLEKILLEFMKEEKGVGIAAPQIGENTRIVICQFQEKKKPVTLCNPKITWYSKETDIAEEGCLSLPGIWGKVERSLEIILQYQDLKGKEVQIKLQGFPARVAQHEIDHLDGILFFDRLSQGFEYDEEVDLKKLGILIKNEQ